MATPNFDEDLTRIFNCMRLLIRLLSLPAVSSSTESTGQVSEGDPHVPSLAHVFQNPSINANVPLVSSWHSI